MREFKQARLFLLVRRFSENTAVWQEAIRYETKRDEAFDLFLASSRVYGRPTEHLVIQAAAGLDSPELEMTERRLVLPTQAQLRELKRQAGFDASETF
jgi:hypothetical protein